MPATAPPTETATLPATLELDGLVKLAGELSNLPEDKLQLAGTRLLSGSRGKVNLRPGTAGVLSLASISAADDDTADTGAAPVTVSAITGDCLTLVFVEPDRDSARHMREMVAAGGRMPPLTGATAAYTEVLGALHRESLAQLELRLEPFFSELASHLLELSSRINQGKTHRDLHYEAAVTVRNKTDAMVRDMLRQISAYYHRLTPADDEDQLWQHNVENGNELNLIDLREFEEYLAIDRMIAMGEDLHKLPLEALVIRLATLVDADPNKLRLPVHVRQLSRALQRALNARGMPQDGLSSIFDFFASDFIRPLRDYYVGLNRLLQERGIRPNVEAEIKSKGSLLADKKKPWRRPQRSVAPVAAAAPEGAPSDSAAQQSGDAGLAETHRQLGQQVATAIGQFTPENLYRSVVDALNFKREAQGLADSDAVQRGAAMSGTWDGATVDSATVDQKKLADAAAIVRALSALQHQPRARDALQRSESLRAYLADNREQMSDLKNTSGLTADSLNQLDMVDNLFGTIKSQLDVSPELQPALGNLQIPLAKLALLDPRFFLDRGHAARGVVNKLSQLATSANFPNKALEARINHIVEEIVADYEHDATVFDTALAKIDKLAEQQARALARNVERVVRTQEGQEKLHRARQAVGEALSARMRPPTAPKVLIDLIESGWRDLLVLTHVREGPRSSTWAEHLKTLDLLCLWLSEQQQGDLEEDLIVQRGLEAEPLIDLIGQQIASALPTNVAHEAVLETLRETLSGSREVELAPVGEELSGIAAEPAAARAKIEDLPRLRRWVKRVEQLEKDSWLTYRDKRGQKRRMQLAWISAARDRYIFVNERGQKVADLSAIQLARQLSRGVQPPAPADQLSAVDQSMYQTLEHVQKTLSFARNHDSLTKLINREVFEDQMIRALRHAQTRSSQHAVLYLNIDQFSLVNEVYDRVIGDQVLLEFARLLAQMHGRKSSSARLGTDEFAVLILDRSLDEAVQAAEQIRSDIENSSVDIDGENVSFTVSIGVAPIAEHSPPVARILESARAAMHRAKERGRNCVVQFEQDQEGVSAYLKEKTRVRQNLEKALATERFVLRAQPIVQTAVSGSGPVSRHYELLLGLSGKDGSLNSPEEFIQSAERYGFMTLVDRWVVREAFSWISQLMDAQKVVPNLAINLSGTSVTDDSFMEFLLEQISEFGVGTSRLCFEITETGTISNLVKAADFVRAFRNIGCKFSIDDFGTGLASHNYLRELPVDFVKIDGSFVTGIHKNRTDYAMARSINDLAHFLGQETIAESVETEEIVDKLREIGVDYLQGWGIGKPKPLADITAELSTIEK